MSSSPTFVSGWLVFMTARVSGPVYTTNPTIEPAASTVFDHNTFSAVSGSIDGTETIGTSFVELGGGVLMVKVPMKVLMSFIGASATNTKVECFVPFANVITDHIFRHRVTLAPHRSPTSDTSVRRRAISSLSHHRVGQFG